MIKYLDLQQLTMLHGDEIHQAVRRVVDSGWFLTGQENKRFEEAYARYTGTSYCVGCGNGLDALTLIFQAYKEMGVMHDGDEVIVPANTYIASILAISQNGLVPVLVEPDEHTFQIDDSLIQQAITPKTKAVLIVHLYGQCAYTPLIARVCREHRLKLVEDNAQAHGQVWKGCNTDGTDAKAGTRTGALGDAAGHSFYPGKNLGALGDAGAVTTNDEQLATLVRTLGNYGSSRKYVFDYRGKNSRMDEIHAAVLGVKLKYLDQQNRLRKEMAMQYATQVHNTELRLPSLDYCRSSVHHIFPVMSHRRDELQRFLAAHGVQTLIHYPIPPHQQQCYSSWAGRSLPITEKIHREELSIPLNPTLSSDDMAQIIRLLNAFH